MSPVEDVVQYLLEDPHDNMLKRLSVEILLKIVKIKIQLDEFDNKYEREILEKIKLEQDRFSGNWNSFLYQHQLEL